MSINKSSEKFTFKVAQKFLHFSLKNFVENSDTNEGFDLEEDTDETDEDFACSTSSKTVIFDSNSLQNQSYFYSFSHQSIKKFILYCSLKLHC